MAKRVLVVDDEPDIQELLKLTLGKEGYDVICTGDGSKAIKMTESFFKERLNEKWLQFLCLSFFF